MEHVGKYSRCNCTGIMILNTGRSMTCVSHHGGATQFHYREEGFPICSGKPICSVVLKGNTVSRPHCLTEGGSFFRNRKSQLKASSQTTGSDQLQGLCTGAVLGFETTALIPIKHGGSVRGFIFIGDERKDMLSSQTVKLLEHVGNCVGSAVHALETQDRLRQLQNTLSARSKMEESDVQTPANQDLMTRLMDSASDSMVISQDWRIVYVNAKATEMANLPKEEMIGRNILDLTYPDDQSAIAERYRKISDGKPSTFSTIARGFDKDGNVRWAEIREIPFLWSGKPAIMSLVNDITQRVNAEEALKRSEERYRLLAENTVDVIYTADFRAHLTYLSPSVHRLLGYTVEEVLQRPLSSMLTPESFRMVMTAMAAHQENDLPASVDPAQSWTMEVEMIRKDGSHIWTEITISCLIGSDKRPSGTVGVVRDITRRKLAEEALRTSEERFRAIIENARDAITILDENLNVVYESPSLVRVSGHQPEEWIGKSISQMDIHPDDVATLACQLEFLKSKPGSVVDDFSTRYKHKDGSWHWIEASGRNLLNDPRVRGIVINFRDITQRKRFEKDLKESERLYRLLAENTSDVIFVTDLDLRNTYVSPSVTRLRGYSVEEAMSHTLREVLSPASLRNAKRSFQSTLAKEYAGVRTPVEERTADMEILCKGGGTIWAEIRVDFLRDERGQPIGILGVARDITERRKTEKELQHRIRLEKLITGMSTRFVGLSSDEIDRGIGDALKTIGEFSTVDRSYIFMFNEDKTMMDLTHEWCSEVARPLMGKLKRVRAGSTSWFVGKVCRSECVHIPEVADLPDAAAPEKAVFQRQGVKSMIVVPIVYTGNVIGFLGLGSIHERKTWDEETIVLLRVVGEIFANALERKRMDLALRESERRYRLLAENITDVIWTTDMQMHITYMSPSVTRLSGYSMEERMKMTIQEMMTPSSYQGCIEIIAKRMTADQLRPKGSSNAWTIEVEMKCKDDSTVWVEEKVTFLRDESGKPVGLLGVTRDISERKKVEDALRLSEQKYRTLVEASPDGVLSIDHRGIIADCNTGLCRMLGYESHELCGQDARRLGMNRDLEAEPCYRAHLIRGEFVEAEIDTLRSDGQALPVWAKLVRLAGPNPSDIRTIVYLRDIADRKKIDEMKDEFIGLVSHELRSPLTVIIGAINTALSEGPRLSQEETRQLLHDAAIEAEQLSHLVGNLLELSRAQANRLFLHVEPVNLAKVVHKVLDTIERQSPKRRFVLDLPRRLTPVYADQLRLERILHNLLENAVKYSPRGSEIAVSAKQDSNRLIVSVTDQGPGISKEDQAKLFKPFLQLGNPILNHTKGAGLGLLVCRRLVEAHGGRIWVESEPDHGATFYFTLDTRSERLPT